MLLFRLVRKGAAVNSVIVAVTSRVLLSIVVVAVVGVVVVAVLLVIVLIVVVVLISFIPKFMTKLRDTKKKRLLTYSSVVWNGRKGLRTHCQ